MSSEKTFSPMIDLLGSPEAAAATAMYRSRALFNRNIYTPSMLMTKEEVSDARKLELSISTEFSAAEHSSGLNASDDPSEVSFVPFPSSRAAYNQTVFSPSMGVTAEELAAMRSAKSRHLVMVSSSCDGDGSVEVLETRPAAAPVQSFRALYNRVIHSPSMGVSQQELEALQAEHHADEQPGDQDDDERQHAAVEDLADREREAHEADARVEQREHEEADGGADALDAA